MPKIIRAAVEKYLYFQDGQEECDFYHFLFTNGIQYEVLESVPCKDGSVRVVIRHEWMDYKYLSRECV